MRVIAAIVALLVSWFGIPQPVSASPLPVMPVAFDYDGNHHPSATGRTAAERGPPIYGDTKASALVAIDRWSYGNSMHSDGPTASSTAAYAYRGESAPESQPTTTTCGDVVSADSELASVQQIQVAAKGGRAITKYDPMAASRNLLGQVGDGYAVTPGGRTISAHAAERIALGGPGRPPTTLARVDDILNNPTGLKYDPVRDTVKVMQGKDFVVVSGTGPQHIVAVMVR